MANKKNKKNFFNLESHHGLFLGLLFLIVSVSSFAIFVFMDSVGNYIDLMHASVVESDVDLSIKRPVVNPRENPFTDLDVTNNNSKAVLELYYLGIVKGYDDGTFKDLNKVNRAEFAKMLVEASDLDYSIFNNLSYCFTDVNDLPEHWYAPAVCASMSSGWVQGYNNGTYGPARNITRIEAYKIVLKVFNFDIPDNSEIVVLPYSDLDSNAWYLGVAQAVKDYGLNPSGSYWLNPNEEITRGEVSTMIYTAMGVKDLL